MKRITILVCLLFPSGVLAAIPMARVIGVIDSRTIAINTNGRQSSVRLKNVEISRSDESAALEYLHRLLDGAWIYVEDGEVYRSPDGLFVNAEMQRHAWLATPAMRYLGPADPAPVRVPAPRGKSGSQSASPRRGLVRRPAIRNRR